MFTLISLRYVFTLSTYQLLWSDMCQQNQQRVILCRNINQHGYRLRSWVLFINGLVPSVLMGTAWPSPCLCFSLKFICVLIVVYIFSTRWRHSLWPMRCSNKRLGHYNPNWSFAYIIDCMVIMKTNIQLSPWIYDAASKIWRWNRLREKASTNYDNNGKVWLFRLIRKQYHTL